MIAYHYTFRALFLNVLAKEENAYRSSFYRTIIHSSLLWAMIDEIKNHSTHLIIQITVQPIMVQAEGTPIGHRCFAFRSSVTPRLNLLAALQLKVTTPFNGPADTNTKKGEEGGCIWTLSLRYNITSPKCQVPCYASNL